MGLGYVLQSSRLFLFWSLLGCHLEEGIVSSPASSADPHSFCKAPVIDLAEWGVFTSRAGGQQEGQNPTTASEMNHRL